MKQLLSSLIIFLFLVVVASAASSAEDLVVSVDRDTLVKVIGAAILAFQAEIWRNQRQLFKRNGDTAEELKALKGYCRGKSGDCPGGDNE